MYCISVQCESPSTTDDDIHDIKSFDVDDDFIITEEAHLDITGGRHGDQAKRSRDYRTSIRSSAGVAKNRPRYFDAALVPLVIAVGLFDVTLICDYRV